MDLRQFFRKGQVDMQGLSSHLDRLDSGPRVAAVRRFSAREQALLFEAAAGFRPLTVNHFVPAAIPALQQVIHYGRNSLPLFQVFEKRFCRAAGEYVSQPLWGYNEQVFRLLTGPGYFTARQAGRREVVIDYCELPPQKAPGWPEILPNSSRLSRFIYYRTRDLVRGVSEHVAVGRATRNGRTLDNWFVLCRQGE